MGAVGLAKARGCPAGGAALAVAGTGPWTVLRLTSPPGVAVNARVIALHVPGSNLGFVCESEQPW